MKPFIISIVLLSFLLFAVIAKVIIVKKKSLFYRYIDKSKKITSFDYFTEFDGDWLFTEIDYKKIIQENESDKLYIISKQKEIKMLIRIFIFLFLLVFILMSKLKMDGEI